MSDYRVHIENTKGEFIPTGILFDPEKEELKRTRKTKELTPKQKKILENKLFKDGDEKAVFERDLGGHINMYYVKNEVIFNNLNLNIANISRVIYLATYIDWNTNNENLLVKPGRYNKFVAMTRKDLQMVLGLSEKPFINFMNDAKNNNLIFEADGKYYMSSEYFNKGKVSFKSKEYTRLYINTVRDLFEHTKPRQHKQLSYLFKLIPKLHHLNNTIVENPDIEDISNVKYMNLIDICRFLGVNCDSKNANRTKKDLLSFHTEYDGVKRYAFKHITVEGENSRYSYFVFNPAVAYCGDDFKTANEILKLCYFNDEN